MIKAAIVEDNSGDRTRLRNCLDFIASTENYTFSVSEFSTGVEFLENYVQDYDIVFMDIDMPGMSGMETARELRSFDSSVILIFVTNMAQYAISGYEVDALDFVLKPVNKYALSLKIKRAASRMTRRIEDYISIRTEDEMRSIRIASIKYMEVIGHYVIYHTMEGDFKEYTTLKEARNRINRDIFVFASRSYLINLQYVDAVDKETVTIGNDKLLISRPQRKPFIAAVSEYMGGKR